MRHTIFLAVLVSLVMPVLFVTSCGEGGPTPVETVNFDPGMQMSGRKIALSVFDKDFPTDWSGYNYLVLTARTSTSQYMYLGMNTDSGYAECSVTFYASDGWIRTAIPLDYFRKRPAASHDMAATFNKKRPFAHIGLHGTQHELVGVDSIGIRMNMPVKESRIDIADVYLSVEDPGDSYLGTKPIVDEFGQWNLGEFEGKVHSEEELRAEWAKEDAELAAFKDDAHSVYGGDLSRKVKATGYFRVEKIDGKWWFVDPDGYLFLSNGSTDIEPGGGGTVLNPLPGMYVENAPEGFVPPADLRRTLGRVVRVQPTPEGESDHIVWLTDWNLYRRHGAEDTERKANQLNIDRMKAWGMNTIGNWSSRALMDMEQVPFMTSLGGIGIQTGIYGMPDVYRDDFEAIVDEGVKQSTARFKDNRMLIGWFLGNEPTWSNKEVLLCDYILEADDAMPMKQALQKHLAQKGDTPESRKAFAYATFEKFVATVDKALKKYDPDHLNLGIRFGAGLPADEVLVICKKYFDVYSFNNYGIEANVRTMDRVSEVTGLPMIIGEYHFGSVDRSLGESVIKVTSPEQRAVAYRNYTEKAFSHPGLIGVCWFAWYDEPLLGRGDGENYNTGLIDATDRPYPLMVEAVKISASRMYGIHDGSVAPFDQRPERAGNTFVDAWNLEYKDGGGIPKPKKREVLTDLGITMQPDEKMQWMLDDKLGMFVHWGLYSGVGKGEWYMENAGVRPEEYRILAFPEAGDRYFDASKFDADDWVDLAKKAGMRYVNMVTEHHDGYALFESRHYNSFTSMQTHGRDFVKEYVEACRKAGLKVGIYKTLINWRYPGYYDIYGTDCKRNNFGYVTDSLHKKNAAIMKEELYCQVKELMTNYGKLDQLYWDGGWIAQQGTDADGAPFWESGMYMSDDNPWPISPEFKDYDEEGRALGLMGIVRKYQPDMLVNPRSGWRGDYTCEEGSHAVTGPIREGVVEKNFSLFDGWGYNFKIEDPANVMPLSQMKRICADCMVRNMCFLANIGPDRFGQVPKNLRTLLLNFGEWVSKVGDAIYGTRGGPWEPVQDQYGFTWKDNKIYVYFLGGYHAGTFALPDLDPGMKVTAVRNLSSDDKVQFSQSGKKVTLSGLNLPEDDIVIVEVVLDRPVS